MTFAEGFLMVLAGLWIAGWLFTMRDVSFRGNWAQKVGAFVILIFIWPHVAWAMTNQSR